MKNQVIVIAALVILTIPALCAAIPARPGPYVWFQPVLLLAGSAAVAVILTFRSRGTERRAFAGLALFLAAATAPFALPARLCRPPRLPVRRRPHGGRQRRRDGPRRIPLLPEGFPRHRRRGAPPRETAAGRDAPHGCRRALARLRPLPRRARPLEPPRRPPASWRSSGAPSSRHDALAAAERLLPRAVRRARAGRGARPPRPSRTDALYARGGRRGGPARRPPRPAALRTDRPLRRCAGKRPRGDARALPRHRAPPGRLGSAPPARARGPSRGSSRPGPPATSSPRSPGTRPPPTRSATAGAGRRVSSRRRTTPRRSGSSPESRCRWLFTTDLRAVLPAYAAAAGRPGTPAGVMFSVRVHEAASPDPVPFLELVLDSRTAYRAPDGRVVPRFRIWRVRTARERAAASLPAPSAPGAAAAPAPPRGIERSSAPALVK